MPWWGLALRLTGLGWYVAACVVGGLFGGYQLDRWAGTLPLFVLIGMVLGSVVAFYGLFRMVVPLLGRDQPSETENGNES
jgi:ATP synthase protein I